MKRYPIQIMTDMYNEMSLLTQLWEQDRKEIENRFKTAKVIYYMKNKKP
jgi:hypothetical protein